MIFVAVPPPHFVENINIFNCISINNEARVKTESGEKLSYMITKHPDFKTVPVFNFINDNLIKEIIAFNENQHTILKYSNELFINSRTMEANESEILFSTYKRVLKSRPTLAGRK